MAKLVEKRIRVYEPQYFNGKRFVKVSPVIPYFYTREEAERIVAVGRIDHPTIEYRVKVKVIDHWVMDDQKVEEV